MKQLKIIFVLVLIVFCGSCKLFIPYTTYYYYWFSDCNSNGFVQYILPTGTVTLPNTGLPLGITGAFKCENGFPLTIAACYTANSTGCWTGHDKITVRIMRGTNREGTTGSGGTVVAESWDYGYGSAMATWIVND